MPIIYEVTSPDPITIGSSEINFDLTDDANISYGINDEEVLAGLTSNDITDNYEPFHVPRYGTGTTALQTAINVASYGTAHQKVYLPNEAMTLDDVYCHYDATNNPGFNSDTNAQGNITLKGTGSGDYQPFVIGGLRTGSVLSFNTDKGLIIGDGSLNTRGVWLRDLSVIGNSTGDIIKFDKVSRNCGIDNAFVWNGGAGNGIVLSDTFLISLKDIYCYLNNSTGIGLQVINPNQGAGIYHFERITTRGGLYSKIIGNHTDNTGSGMGNITMIGCQELNGVNGLWLGWGAQRMNIISHWQENLTGIGTKIFRGAGNITFYKPYFSLPNATIEVLLGESGATAAVKDHSNITFFQPRHVWVDAVCYERHSAIDAATVKIIDPVMSETAAGTAIAFNLNNEIQHGLIIERPQYINAFATKITYPDVVDLLIDYDTLGQYTWNQVHLFNDHVDVQQGYMTVPTATTTEIENIASYTNTGPEKKAGTIYRNSTTGKLVQAVGGADGDVWQDADGVLAHTPA